MSEYSPVSPTVVQFPACSTARDVCCRVPLTSITQAAEALTNLRLAVDLALMTLATAGTHGAATALEGVESIMQAVATLAV